jgi:hypothetical protein
MELIGKRKKKVNYPPKKEMKSSEGYLLDSFVVENDNIDINALNAIVSNKIESKFIDKNNNIEDNMIKKTKKKRIIKKKSSLLLNIDDYNNDFNSAKKIITNINKSKDKTTSNLLNDSIIPLINNIPLISLNSIRELRSFNNPSIVVKDILKSICMLFGEELDLSWKNVKKIISKSNFIIKINCFDYKSLDSNLRRKISKFINKRFTSFDYDLVNKVSMAVSPFIPFIKANLKYSLMFEKMENNNKKQGKIQQVYNIKSDIEKNPIDKTNIIDKNIDGTIPDIDVEELSKLKLLLNDTKKSCSKLTKCAFNECRSFINPPLAILNVFKAVVRLLDVKDLSWKNIKTNISKYSFFNDFFSFDIRKININIRKKVSKFVKLNYQSFDEEYLSKCSLAVVPFASWVKANLTYHIKYSKLKSDEMNLVKRKRLPKKKNEFKTYPF